MVGLLWLTVLAVMMLHTGCFSTHRSVPISESLAKLGLNVKEYPDDDFSHILGVSDPSHEPSKLQNICRMRLETVERYKTPVDRDGCGIDWSMYISADDYLEDINDFDERYGKPIDLAEQIMSKYPMAIAAEFKKASPSKGEINLSLDPVEQCLQYASIGAAVISVLTEFDHFKGTLDDLRKVRLATQKELGEKRPVILRKDFILDRYQILEARANGADTILLMVSVLGRKQLADLVAYARRMGMEPLVEVHADCELEIALAAGARVIGVNNRNLHTFQLDLGTTTRVIELARAQGKRIGWSRGEGGGEQKEEEETPALVFAALSGISGPSDIHSFRRAGASCCLIGETLMKAADPKATIQRLLAGAQDDYAHGTASGRLVKICGNRRKGDAAAALSAGANLIGVIFAPSKRQASLAEAQDIVQVCRAYGERRDSYGPRLGAALEVSLCCCFLLSWSLSLQIQSFTTCSYLHYQTLNITCCSQLFFDAGAARYSATWKSRRPSVVHWRGGGSGKVVSAHAAGGRYLSGCYGR
jgi:indole-3-glycerol phosphate synthase